MLPTLGQLITPDTDVAVDETYLFAVLDEDGSRRVVGEGFFSSTTTVERVIEVRGLNVVFWGPNNIGGLTGALNRAARDGWYLPYPPADGIAVFPVEEPVNQVPEVASFREHASRFAHQLDDALGHHSLTSASEEDRMVTYQTLSSMLGSGWRRYKIWDATAPQELIVGGNYDGTLLWKRQRPEYVGIDERMCGQCDIATFARRFRFQANLPLFRRLYRSGIIYVANRETTPKWDATIFDVATDPVSAFYDNLEVEYHQALLYYDEVVGAQETNR